VIEDLKRASADSGVDVGWLSDHHANIQNQILDQTNEVGEGPSRTAERQEPW
jgi:hypothetical protein